MIEPSADPVRCPRAAPQERVRWCPELRIRAPPLRGASSPGGRPRPWRGPPRSRSPSRACPDGRMRMDLISGPCTPAMCPAGVTCAASVATLLRAAQRRVLDGRPLQDRTRRGPRRVTVMTGGVRFTARARGARARSVGHQSRRRARPSRPPLSAPRPFAFTRSTSGRKEGDDGVGPRRRSNGAAASCSPDDLRRRRHAASTTPACSATSDPIPSGPTMPVRAGLPLPGTQYPTPSPGPRSDVLRRLDREHCPGRSRAPSRAHEPWWRSTSRWRHRRR